VHLFQTGSEGGIMKTIPCVLSTLLTLITPAFATVTVTSPTNGTAVTSPVHYVASATAATCAKGVASMGVYVDGTKIYVVKGATLNTEITMSAGSHQTTVEEWDYCSGATVDHINLTVEASAAPIVAITAKSSTITAGSSSILTVTATNATVVTVTGTNGTSYTLSASGGTETVTPTATATYTAKASGADGSTSVAATVTVIPAASLQSISHVLFMLQENHSFDNYFGMLNPYRKANGWNVGEDGVTYNVDGIDDKLSTIGNTNDAGNVYRLFKLTSTCLDDMSSDWLSSYGDVNTYDFLATRPILMNGFVHNAAGFAKSCASGGSTCAGAFTDINGERAMGYYDQGFLNYYYYMASQFAVSDRWFSPVASKSIDNRIATFTGGTTQGLVRDPGGDDHQPQLNISNIFQELDAAKVSWKIYYTVTEGYCLAENDCSGSAYDKYPATDFSNLIYSFQYLHENPKGAACAAPTQGSSVVGDGSNSFCIDTAHIAPLSTYYSDLSDGTLPSFAFIEAGYAHNDEHPGSGQSILEGQAQVAKVVNAFMASPEWVNSIFFLSYDEGGGPYDHVPPVPGHSNENTDASLGDIPDIASIAVNADTYGPCLPAGGTPTLHCDLVSNYPGAKPSDAPAVDGFAAQLGFRLPNMIISPYTRKHYVSHTPMDHTAVIKFVENRFIGSTTHLTPRDAAQPNLLEFFDFAAPQWATPPTPPAPVTAGSLGHDPCTPTSMGP
jgi:phospholipase C